MGKQTFLKIYFHAKSRPGSSLPSSDLETHLTSNTQAVTRPLGLTAVLWNHFLCHDTRAGTDLRKPSRQLGATPGVSLHLCFLPPSGHSSDETMLSLNSFFIGVGWETSLWDWRWLISGSGYKLWAAFLWATNMKELVSLSQRTCTFSLGRMFWIRFTEPR